MQLPEMETHTKGVGAGREERRQPEHTTILKLCDTDHSNQYVYILSLHRTDPNVYQLLIGYRLKTIIIAGHPLIQE